MTDTRERILGALLRIGGVVMCTAFLAVLMPSGWMVSTHRGLGLGELPMTPIVEYLARSVAALYGFHGILLLIVSRDPGRHRTIVRYVAAMNVVFGLIMLLVDLEAGMPTWWTVGEGPPLVALGIVIALLDKSIAAEGRRR